MATDRTPPGMVFGGALLVSFIALVVAGASTATGGRDRTVGWAVVAWAILLMALAAWVRLRPAARTAEHGVRDAVLLAIAGAFVAGAVVLLLAR
jgi:hypothetical protein